MNLLKLTNKKYKVPQKPIPRPPSARLLDLKEAGKTRRLFIAKDN